MNSTSKEMTSKWQWGLGQLAAFAVAITICPFSSLAEIAVDQADTDTSAPRKQVIEKVTAQAAHTNELKVSLALKDGSQIIGTPIFKSLPLTTSYGKVEPKLEMVGSLQFTPDHDKVNIAFRNGDTLTGSLGMNEFNINAIFGRVRIETAVVTSLEVLAGNSGLDTGVISGLVLYYSFDSDENGKVTDKSGKGNNGIVHGAKWVQQGKRGGAYGFNGRDAYVDVSGFQPSTGPNAWSVAAWFKTSGSSHPYGEETICGWGSDGHGNVVHVGFVCPNGHDPYFGAGFKYIPPIDYLVNLQDGMWHQGVITYDGSTIRIYTDGGYGISGSISLNIGTGDMVVGNRIPAISDNYWNGSLDEIRIYNRALTTNEIQMLYGE